MSLSCFAFVNAHLLQHNQDEMTQQGNVSKGQYFRMYPSSRRRLQSFLNSLDVVNVEFHRTPCRRVLYLTLHLKPPENLKLNSPRMCGNSAWNKDLAECCRPLYLHSSSYRDGLQAPNSTWLGRADTGHQGGISMSTFITSSLIPNRFSPGPNICHVLVRFSHRRIASPEGRRWKNLVSHLPGVAERLPTFL